MSFTLLKSEPNYNYLSDTYSWEFYNVFNLLQYQMCSGEVRYVLHLNFSKAEILYTTKGKDITEIEFCELETLMLKKLWYHFNEQSVKINDAFETVNQLANQKGL